MRTGNIIIANKNAERLQVQSTNIVDFELDLFNKHARRVHHYTVLRFQGDAAIHRYVDQETFVTAVATLLQFFLVFFART